MSDITLSSGVRQNLLTLQSTADMMSRTQNRLSTGNKVNSALDNPNSFFTATGLNARGSDLMNLLDDMGQGIQTIKAADEGITAITKLVESAKAKANQALQTQSQFERKALAAQYNELLGQIQDLAQDASYKGKNLLAGDGNDLTVLFNEDSTSKLEISAVDFTDSTLAAGLNLSPLEEGAAAGTSFSLAGGTATVTLTGLQSTSLLTGDSDYAVGDVITVDDGTTTDTLTIAADTTVQDYVNFLKEQPGIDASFNNDTGALTIRSNYDVDVDKDNTGGGTAVATAITAAALTATSTLVTSAGFKAGDVISIKDGNGYEARKLAIDETTTVQNFVDLINGTKGLSAQFAGGTVIVEGDVDFTIDTNNADFNRTEVADTVGTVTIDADDSGFATDDEINNTVSAINAALSTLREQASTFGSNLSTVEIRQDFTKKLINTLTEGASKLTLADTNEEGANLLALQTRQQLSTTSLSFASQADQAVLRLF